jgi:hypothetical protein
MMILPLDSYNLYNRYKGTGLEESMIYCASYPLEDVWSVGNSDVPSYNQALDLLLEYGEVAAIYETSLRTITDERPLLLVYSKALLANVRLGPAFDSLVNYENDADTLPVVADYRLRGQYAIGDKLYENTVFTKPNFLTKTLEIVGFLDSGNEHFRYHESGSNPSLSMIVEGYNDPDRYMFITIENEEINPSIYSTATVLFFPSDESAKNDEWRDMWHRKGRGVILSFDEMMNRDIMVSFLGEDNVFLLVSIWCFIMLALGLRGIEANITYSLIEQMTVYKLLGMRYKKWVQINVLALGVPFAAAMFFGALLSASLMGRLISSNLVFEVTLLNLALFTLLLTPIMLKIREMWRRNSIVSTYYEREVN